MKIISNKPISEYLHAYVVKRLKKHSIRTVIDMGGIGKLNGRGFEISNANIRNGINGTNLPYEDNAFDASVSIAVLEHVDNQMKFLKEAIRVAKKISIHWFPMSKHAEQLERLTKDLGYNHPCKIPNETEIIAFLQSGEFQYSITPLTSCSEHLLLLAGTYPERLNTDILYDGVFKYHHKRYGVVLEIRK